jgi:hypothetical protein
VDSQSLPLRQLPKETLNKVRLLPLRKLPQETLNKVRLLLLRKVENIIYRFVPGILCYNLPFHRIYDNYLQLWGERVPDLYGFFEG